MVFTPPVISLRTLFCAVSKAFRVELLAVTSTSLPYFMTGLTYVLYVVLVVSCVLPHVAPVSHFRSLSLWLTLFIVCSTWFFQDSLLSMCTPRYFVLSLFGSFWLLIFRSKLLFLWRMEKNRYTVLEAFISILFSVTHLLREFRAVLKNFTKLFRCQI